MITKQKCEIIEEKEDYETLKQLQMYYSYEEIS